MVLLGFVGALSPAAAAQQSVAGNKALASAWLLRKHIVMTRAQVESAAASGAPFTLRMADGREYGVPHRDYVSIPPKGLYVIVYDDRGRFRVLPLPTMTGLESSVPGNGGTSQ